MYPFLILENQFPCYTCRAGANTPPSTDFTWAEDIRCRPHKETLFDDNDLSITQTLPSVQNCPTNNQTVRIVKNSPVTTSSIFLSDAAPNLSEESRLLTEQEYSFPEVVSDEKVFTDKQEGSMLERRDNKSVYNAREKEPAPISKSDVAMVARVTDDDVNGVYRNASDTKTAHRVNITNDVRGKFMTSEGTTENHTTPEGEFKLEGLQRALGHVGIRYTTRVKSALTKAVVSKPTPAKKRPLSRFFSCFCYITTSNTTPIYYILQLYTTVF